MCFWVAGLLPETGLGVELLLLHPEETGFWLEVMTPRRKVCWACEPGGGHTADPGLAGEIRSLSWFGNVMLEELDLC